MDEAEKLSALIGSIYDTSLDPSLWPAVLKESARFACGWSGALFAKDAASKAGEIYYNDGVIDDEHTELYFSKYVRLDPFTTAHFFAEIGEPIAVADVMSYEEYTATTIFREWLQPQGIIDCACVALDKTSTSAALLGIFRHQRQGRVDDEMRRRVRLLAPHVRRAVLISQAIELKTTQADTFAATLDGLAAGMFLVDAIGRIVHANAAGHAMLAEARFLRAINGRLAATDPEADRGLRDLFAAASLGDKAVGTNGISVPLVAGKGEQLVAHALPLSSGTRRNTGKAYRATAALFVHKATLETPAPPEAIAKTFKLTPMELRVLLGIVEVGGVPEVAEALGIAPSTVSTHLKHLYAKTGTNRQVDLVKLVARFSSPLV